MTLLSSLTELFLPVSQINREWNFTHSEADSRTNAGDVVVILGAGQIPGTQVQKPLKNLKDCVQQFFDGRGGKVQVFKTPLWHTESDRLIIHKDPDTKMLDMLTAASYEFVLTHYNRDMDKAVEGGKLIIVGFSYGGVLANYLAKRVGKIGIPKSLMVLLDPALGPDSHKIDRTIDDDVDFCYNVWQQQNFKGLFKSFFGGYRLNNPLASYGSSYFRKNGTTDNICNMEVEVRHGYVVYEKAYDMVEWVMKDLQRESDCKS